MRVKWLDQLSARDRNALILAVLVLGGALVFLFAVEPYLAYRARLETSVLAARDTRAWMTSAAAEVKRLRGSARPAKAGDGRSLLARIDASTRQYRVSGGISRLEPSGRGQVRVWLKQVKLDDLLRWLAALQVAEGLYVQELRLQRDKIAGMASGRIVFAGRG